MNRGNQKSSVADNSAVNPPFAASRKLEYTEKDVGIRKLVTTGLRKVFQIIGLDPLIFKIGCS